MTSFGINFFNSGLSPANRFHISGISGKLLDNDGNYIHSYYPNNAFTISGNVFTGKHNIFIDGVAKNLNCSRQTGSISGVILTPENFNSLSLTIRN